MYSLYYAVAYFSFKSATENFFKEKEKSLKNTGCFEIMYIRLHTLAREAATKIPLLAVGSPETM